MKRSTIIFGTIVLLHFLSVSPLIADNAKGDVKYTQWGKMDGNAVRTLYSNHAEVANWPEQPSGEWPKGTGHSYVDGVATIISASTVDTLGNIIHPMSTNYREFIDLDPNTGEPWGWAPLPGYSNPNQPFPARSDDEHTWPYTWPDRPEWEGYWNGYFGKGIKNADLETYFVCDDTPDSEWLMADDDGSDVFFPIPSDITLLTQGGFESSTPAFFYPAGIPNSGTLSWTESDWRSGGRALRIFKYLTNGTGNWLSDNRLLFPPSENEDFGTVEVGIWVKTEYVNDEPQNADELITVFIHFEDANGMALTDPLELAVPQDTTDTDWQAISAVVPEGVISSDLDAVIVEILMGRQTTGYLFLDDFFLRDATTGEMVVDLYNPNFDLPGSWTARWPGYATGNEELPGTSVVEMSALESFQGNRSLRVAKTAGEEVWIQSDVEDFLNDESHITITARGLLYVDPSVLEELAADSTAMAMMIYWYGLDDEGTWGEIGIDTVRLDLPDNPAEWHLYQTVILPPLAASELSLAFRHGPQFEGVVYWDDIRVAKTTPRGGLGMEVNTRGFQWHHVLAQDVIFWHYEITNESITDYDSVFFAQYIDWGIGGTQDSGDDEGGYNTYLDIAFAWDYNGQGQPGQWGPTATSAYAFLESPGNPFDDLDNDEDGLLNEARDNAPGSWLDVYPYGVDDTTAFIAYYGRSPRSHWEGDEDQDWMGYDDLNGNGVWDEGEPLNDDVGYDGQAPYHEGYNGPDEGEGDGIPTDGEPNFNATDKDESDQLGLTGFSVFDVHAYELQDDEQDWGVFMRQPEPFDQYLTGGRNLGMFFSSGPFEMPAGHTERFSMALLFARQDFPRSPTNDEIRNSSLARKKETVQQIYNADYRFAMPPLKPRLTAIPGDGQVILYWDDRSESSFDPFLKEFDFEGYKIYRSTEPFFNEIRTITNTYGEAMFLETLTQWDLVNEYEGLHPVDIDGHKYYLGSNSGLRHYYIDNDVVNGMTYYYALVAYDRGNVGRDSDGNFQIDHQGHARGISPSECTAIFQQIGLTNLYQTDMNTAIITPRSNAAGYIEGQIQNVSTVWDTISGPATGFVELLVIEQDSVLSGHEYELQFLEDAPHHDTTVPILRWQDATDGTVLMDSIPVSLYGQELPVTDGIGVILYNDSLVTVIEEETGWAPESTTNFGVDAKKLEQADDIWSTYGNEIDEQTGVVTERNVIPYPADYMIFFSADTSMIDTSLTLGAPTIGSYGRHGIPVPFTIWNVTENRRASFGVVERIQDGNNGYDYTWQVEEPILILTGPEGHDPVEMGFSMSGWELYNYRTAWMVTLFPPEDPSITPVEPTNGDAVQIFTTKPFRNGETIKFSVAGAFTDERETKKEMDEIYVVPNPYVATNLFEPPNTYLSGRGERRIYFMNLPHECTIHIYTKTGKLVDTIKHNGNAGEGMASWDLISKDGMEIAYGVYFYTVEALDKVSTGKFAVIK